MDELDSGNEDITGLDRVSRRSDQALNRNFNSAKVSHRCLKLP